MSYSLEIEVSSNPGASRTGKIELTQASSGKTITINIEQQSIPKTQVYIEFISGNKVGESGAYDLYDVNFVSTTPVASDLTISYVLGHGTSHTNGNQTGETTIRNGTSSSTTIRVRVVAGNYPEIRDASISPNEDDEYTYMTSGI